MDSSRHVRRRSMRRAAAVLLLAAGTTARAARAGQEFAAPPADDDKKLIELQAEVSGYLRDRGNDNPWGVSTHAAVAGDSATLSDWLRRLQSLDRARITDPATARTLPLTAGWVRASLGAIRCRDELLSVDQLFGFQVQIGLSFATRPLGTEPSRAALLRGAARVPEAVRRQIANLREGLRLGLAAPRNNVERVIAQLDGMRIDATGSVLLAPSTRDTSRAFARAWTAMLADSVAPALSSYRNFLAEYLPRARPEPALASLPEGRQCYAAKMALAAGAPASLDALYDEAVQGRLTLMPELRAETSRLFGDTLPLAAALLRIRTDPRLVMQDPDSILAAFTQALARLHSSLTPLFERHPDAPLSIRAIPASQAASQAPARYQAAARDGSAPAIFYVNAFQPGGVARMNIELGAAHEGYPGHHFQAIYGALSGGSRQVPAFLVDGAYVEGWGIYAERLADEIGAYSTPLTRLGYLVHMLDVYTALQADIGMHDRGWTRAAVIDTMMYVAGRPRAQAESYADRHAATPGQLASYGIGYLAITDARDRAQRRLGDRFTEAAFHDIVLAGGGSLQELQARADAWEPAPVSPPRP